MASHYCKKDGGFVGEKMTLAQKAIMEKYTEIRRVQGERCLFLKSDHQAFEILTGPNVAWYRRQLAIALARMIDKEGKSV